MGPDPTIRRQVMSAAREVLRRDAEASVETISRAAGVSRATFYRHFGSRERLLASVAHEPRPPARSRILAAAQEMLVTTSLDDLSMDRLAAAAGVSRGTLYRLFPGKPALLSGLIAAFAPFPAMRQIVAARWDDPPDVVVPLVVREVVGVAGERLGLMRAVFHEVTAGSAETAAGVRPLFAESIGPFIAYFARQMDLGRVRRMDPLLALQACMGPIFFHLLTRPVMGELLGREVDPTEAVQELVAVSVAGLTRTA